MKELTPPTTFDGLARAVARVEPARGGVVGTVLGGNYELTERIGGGGMGIVFRARDRRLGRDVAVKTLRIAREGDEDVLRLFEREARATAQLLHPNIVTLHHVGEHDGVPFLVLELLTGETLAARLARRGRLPLAEALAIVDAVLVAVAFAHQRGVLHRDLKPSNVFITADQRTKVLDFGIALSLDTDVGPLTRGAGTPGYMAPEQRGGGAQDSRTDVWAAARLLVECLLGRHPDDHEALAQLAEQGLDRDLHATLARALDPDPSKRPESADELRSLLELATTRRAARPRRFAMIGLAIIAAASLAAAAIAFVHRAPKADVIAASEIDGKLFEGTTGNFVMRIESDGTAYGVYAHADGTITGRYEDGVFTGFWCDKPTRKPPLNAGFAKLRFVRGEGRLLIDGAWLFGEDDSVPWRATFLGYRVTTPPDPALLARLALREGCPGH